MSRGPSGRIVVEIDPEMKRRLYARLEADGHTFKSWLLERVAAFLDGTAVDDGYERHPSHRTAGDKQ